MAGAPTIAPTSGFTGKRATFFDDTDGIQWAYLGSRYVALNRGGKGTAIASAGTLTPVAAERAMRDYWHVTGTTTVNFFTTTAADVFAPIKDGPGHPPVFRRRAHAHAQRGISSREHAAISSRGQHQRDGAAGTRMTFVMDTAQGGWVETARVVA